MTKKVLEILDFEDKKTTSGRGYTRFKTNEGWISCFDTKTNEELKQLKGKSANCEVSESGEFKNIKKYLGEAEEEVKAEVIQIENKEVKEFPQAMKVSYAKDCFCAITSRISQSVFDDMTEEERLGLADLAIKVIKKIESAFRE